MKKTILAAVAIFALFLIVITFSFKRKPANYDIQPAPEVTQAL